MTDDLKVREFDSEEERLVAALAVAVLGLDLIAKSKSADRCRRDAAVVLEHLARVYGVTPDSP
jgi:hypothetical protein